jgi:hypothetical protein
VAREAVAIGQVFDAVVPNTAVFSKSMRGAPYISAPSFHRINGEFAVSESNAILQYVADLNPMPCKSASNQDPNEFYSNLLSRLENWLTRRGSNRRRSAGRHCWPGATAQP